MRRGTTWLLAILLLTPFAVWQFYRQQPAEPPLPILYTLGGDFTLDSTLGTPLSLSDLEGRIVLLNFGYTGCPDVCPTALSRMRDAVSLLEHELEGEKSRIQPVFVTLDPDVDSIDRIEPYVHFFHPTFIGLTGSPSAITAAAAPFKVFYEKVFPEMDFDETGTQVDSTGGYTISHSSHIYLLDTAGRVRATFGQGVPVPDIARAMDQLLREPDLLARSNDA